jgi:DNA-binding transcriptional regulator LsrR (DeoR family)
MSMRKIKEVLRLRFELKLGQREIARACSISQGAVHSYLKKAVAARIHSPLPEGWNEDRVEEALFGEQRPVVQPHERTLPDFPALHDQSISCSGIRI